MLAGVGRYLAVVGRELVQQLLDPVPLPGTVDVGDPVLRQAAEVLVDLEQRCQTPCKTVLSARQRAQSEDLQP